VHIALKGRWDGLGRALIMRGMKWGAIRRKAAFFGFLEFEFVLIILPDTSFDRVRMI
jgi:hypothetical protein